MMQIGGMRTGIINRSAQAPTFRGVNQEELRERILTKLEPLVDKAIERAEEQLITGNSKYQPEARGAAMVLSTVSTLLSNYPAFLNRPKSFYP